MATQILTQDYVRSLFHYDPEAGVLTWKWRPREHFSSDRGWRGTNTRCADKPTGSRLNSDGYQEVGIDRRIYKAHRIIWLLVHGEQPEEVDHENGVRHDNRLDNLRASTRKLNMKNKGMRKDNKSGANGVGWHAKDRRWIAFIGIDGRFKRIGAFKDKDAAIAARMEAEQKLGYTERHGR